MDKSQNPPRSQSKIAEFQDPDASEEKFPENALKPFWYILVTMTVMMG